MDHMEFIFIKKKITLQFRIHSYTFLNTYISQKIKSSLLILIMLAIF